MAERHPPEPIDPEDKHRLLAAPDYQDEWEYLDDDASIFPFEPGDYLDDRRR